MEAIERPRWSRGEQGACSVGAIDVQPDSTLAANPADTFEIVERAGGSRAGGGHHSHHAFAFIAQTIQRHDEQIDIDLVVARSDRNAASPADAKLPDRARDRVVRVFSIADARRIAANAVLPRVGNRRIPRSKHRREVRFRSARRECPSRPRSVAGQLCEPRYDTVLDHRCRRRHLPHRERLVERADHALHPNAYRERGRSLVAHVHRVVVLVGIGDDLALETGDYLFHRLAVSGKIFVEPALELVRRERSRYLTLGTPRRLEVSRCHRCELLSDVERGIGLQLGENVIDHSANLLDDRVRSDAARDRPQASSKPFCRTKSASSPRELTFSFTKMLERWVLTVLEEICSSPPISLFDFRAATMRAISISRPVSPAAPAVTVLGGGLTPRSRISSRVPVSSPAAPSRARTSWALRNSRAPSSRSPISTSAPASLRLTRAACGGNGIASSCSADERSSSTARRGLPSRNHAIRPSHASAYASPSRCCKRPASLRMRAECIAARSKSRAKRAASPTTGSSHWRDHTTEPVRSAIPTPASPMRTALAGLPLAR